MEGGGKGIFFGVTVCGKEISRSDTSFAAEKIYERGYRDDKPWPSNEGVHARHTGVVLLSVYARRRPIPPFNIRSFSSRKDVAVPGLTRYRLSEVRSQLGGRAIGS